eukprot:924672_1
MTSEIIMEKSSINPLVDSEATGDSSDNVDMRMERTEPVESSNAQKTSVIGTINYSVTSVSGPVVSVSDPVASVSDPVESTNNSVKSVDDSGASANDFLSWVDNQSVSSVHSAILVNDPQVPVESVGDPVASVGDPVSSTNVPVESTNNSVKS